MADKTALHGLHLELGAKMTPFAGYDMPLHYKDGMKREHLHCREAAGLFDVSHMGQFMVSGPGLAQALEAMVPADLEALADNQQVYTLFLNEGGGILDDLIITRWSEERFFVVVNAACKRQDLEHLRQGLPEPISVEEMGQQALLALQGPKAPEVMQGLAPDSLKLSFMRGAHLPLLDTECYVTRSGYTGEDGFEISAPPAVAERLARHLLDLDEVAPMGLGARDSLRLEAGLCLYGHDMNTETTPLEASLAWTVAKDRRQGGGRPGGFPGAERIFQHMADGVARKRVGLKVTGRVPAREGAELQDGQGKAVGTVCSGGFAPSLGQPVAMAYVDLGLAKPDTELQAMVRDKAHPATVTKMPFVPHRYHHG